MKQNEMNISNTPVSHWPRSIYDPETDSVRIVSHQRASQLAHYKESTARKMRWQRTEKRRKYVSEWNRQKYLRQKQERLKDQ